MKETDCRKCRVSEFKYALCKKEFCEKYYSEGRAEDFEKLLPHWIPAKTTDDGWTILDSRIDRKMSILVTYKTVTGRRYVKQVEVGACGCRGYISKKLNGRITAWMPLPEPYKEAET